MALVGWFLMVPLMLEGVFGQDLSALENFMETNTVKWSIRAFVFFICIVVKRRAFGWQ